MENRKARKKEIAAKAIRKYNLKLLSIDGRWMEQKGPFSPRAKLE